MAAAFGRLRYDTNTFCQYFQLHLYVHVTGLIMSIDFEKCFDMISHQAIRKSMEYFGIGNFFIRAVMLLFTDFQLCTQNNGYISDWLTPTRGLHQGCCISPHLMLLMGQIFADLLQNNQSIQGISIHNIVMLLSQFADDTNLFLKASASVLDAVSNTLEHAHSNLGLKVNYEKSTLYRVGSLQHTNATYYTQKAYAWGDPPISSLGIQVALTNMAVLNLSPILDNMQAIITAWRLHDLTLTGRILVVNTLIESLFVY